MKPATRKQVDTLKAMFTGMDTFPLSHASKLGAILDKAPEEALVVMVKEKVKFCYLLARTRLVRLHAWTDEQVNAIS